MKYENVVGQAVIEIKVNVWRLLFIKKVTNENGKYLLIIRR